MPESSDLRFCLTGELSPAADATTLAGFKCNAMAKSSTPKAPRSKPAAQAGADATTTPKARTGGRASSKPPRRSYDVKAPPTDGKELVIVESPTKAKTINKYLGSGYVVMASVGHVRDLPERAPKGIKQPVPGVDLEHDFAPTYEVMADKQKTVTALKKAAKDASGVWFATDLDREGEAIAWHLAQSLNITSANARRVVFNAITKTEIQNAFANPRPIDEHRVNAQQARRILDRIVGYQVSPLLWKKVAGGLSAGRVQSVAVRVVVEREREIEKFIPQEQWRVAGYFTTLLEKAGALSEELTAYLADVATGTQRTGREKTAWVSQHSSLLAELVELQGKSVELVDRDTALAAVQSLGFSLQRAVETTDANAKGPAQNLVTYIGALDPKRTPAFSIASIATKRTTSRPPAPFITSTLQQQASIQLGFGLQRTMRIAQQLYEGIDIGGADGQVGLITYMRTDSTHVSGEALNMARTFIDKSFGQRYLPEKPNFFTSSNKAAQEAHEAVRPTDVNITPQRVRTKLNDEQFKLYDLIWKRFVACQMVPAEWDSTAVLIRSAAPANAVFKSTGRTLVFDGFLKVAGLPSTDEAILPPLKEQQPVAALRIDPSQHFTSPPPRYNEASLQKKLEEEGIGRPSTYAAIIQTIQDRKYVAQIDPRRDRRLYATDLGKVVTDMLVTAFPKLMDVSYTRQMETELDKIEEENLDWVKMLREFYGPFKQSLDGAFDSVLHAKATTEPAPYTCAKCGSPTVYRFGRNGRFLSCSTYPECDYAAPIDRQGKPQPPEVCDVMCQLCGSPMTRRTGRFGAFLSCSTYPACKGILKLDAKKGTLVPPKVPPLLTDIPCTKCGSMLNLRSSKRGPWLSCSAFPKCRGRMGWSAVEEKKQQEWEQKLSAHEKANPVPVIRNDQGQALDDTYLPRILGGAVDSSPTESVPEGDSQSSADAA
jgi:DNA topoisomerase I